MKVNFKIFHVLVGVDDDGKDMTTILVDSLEEPCPNNCDPNSPLNN